jgi:hypothetical protein
LLSAITEQNHKKPIQSQTKTTNPRSIHQDHRNINNHGYQNPNSETHIHCPLKPTSSKPKPRSSNPLPVVVSGVEASLFQSEAASVKIKNKNLNVNISAVEGQGRREKKPGLSWIEIWVEGEIWVLKEKELSR